MRMRDWGWKVLGISGMLAGVLGCRKAEKRLSIEERAVTQPDEPSPAQKTLDRIDGRIPVPLLPMMANHQKQNMRDHLLAVQEVILASSAGDFPAIEKAATRMGYSEQMGQMCTHMGTGAPGFTEQALAFHHTADTIGAAARRRDGAAVMEALGSTLQTCTGCHATFRQSVVDEATWNRLTPMVAPMGHGMSQ
jgi:hypothetical protein